MEAGGRVLRPIPKDNARVVPPQRGVVYVVERVGRFHRIIDSETQGPLMPLVERIVCALSSRDETIKIPRTRVLSADRNTLSVGGFATIRVVDPRLAAYSVENVDETVRNVASVALRAAAATLTKAALCNSPQLLAEATKTRIHNSVSQWGCKCTAFVTSNVRESGARTKSSRDVRQSSRSSTSVPTTTPQQMPIAPSPKSRQNKYSARRQGSLLAQHLLDDNARLTDGNGNPTGRAAAAAAVAELTAAQAAHKHATDNPSPGWLVPTPPQSQAAAPTPRRESPSPASVLEARKAQARESAAVKRQRAIDNATVAPKRTTSPKESKEKAADAITDKTPPVSRAAVVPESATSKLVRVEPRRKTSSPLPVRTSPPQRVPAPLPSRATRTTTVPSAQPTIVVLDATKKNEPEEGIVFQVANPSPRSRRITTPKTVPPSLQRRISPRPKLIAGPSPPQLQVLPTPNSVPKVVPALPAPAQQPNQLAKQADENRVVPGALASAVSAAMRDITALAAAENKQAILDTSQINPQNNSPPDASNDFTPPPPPPTPPYVAPAPHVPANRSKKLSSYSQSRRLSAAANLQIYPASAPASLASSGDEIRAQIELIRRSSAGSIPATRRAPDDGVVEQSSVALKMPSNATPTVEEKSADTSPSVEQKENEPQLENQQPVVHTRAGVEQADAETLGTAPPSSLVIHDGQEPIPLPLAPAPTAEQGGPSDSLPAKSEEIIRETLAASENDTPAPAQTGSTPPTATGSDSATTSVSLSSPNPTDSERLPPPITPVSDVVVAEPASVDLFRRALTPPNTMETGSKGEVGSETSDEPGDPDAEYSNDAVFEPSVALVPSPDSSPVTNSSDEQEGVELHTGESHLQLETSPRKSDMSERVSEKLDNDDFPLGEVAQDDLMPVPEQAPRFVPQRGRRSTTRAQKIILDDEDDRHISYVPRDYGYSVMEPRRARRKEPRIREQERRYDDDEGGDPDEDMHEGTTESALNSRDESREETREEKRHRRQERRERKARRERKRQQIAEYHEQLRAAAEAEAEAEGDPDADLSDGWRDENRRNNRRTRSREVGSDDESDPDMQGSSIERPSRWSPPSAEHEDLYWRGHERDLDRDHRKRTGGSGGTSTRERKRRERDTTPHSRAERADRSRSSSRTRDDRRTSSGRRRYEEEHAAARSSRSRSASTGASSRRNPESWEAEQIPDPRRTRSRSSSRDVDRKRRSASADTRVTPRDKERRMSGERTRPSTRSRSAMGARERSPSRRRAGARHRSDMGFGTFATTRRSTMSDGTAVRPIYNHGAYDDSESDSANAKYIPWYCEGQSDVEDDPSEMRCLYISANGRTKCNHPRCVTRRKRRRRLLRRGRHVSYHPHIVWASDDAANGRRY